MYLPTSNQNSHQRKRKWSVSPLEVGGQVTRFPGCIVRCRCIAHTSSCANTKLSLAHTNLVWCRCIARTSSYTNTPSSLAYIYLSCTALFLSLKRHPHLCHCWQNLLQTHSWAWSNCKTQYFITLAAFCTNKCYFLNLGTSNRTIEHPLYTITNFTLPWSQ